MKPEHEAELIDAGAAFLEAVFRELELEHDDGRRIFREGARFEKALGAARDGRRRSFGSPMTREELRAVGQLRLELEG